METPTNQFRMHSAGATCDSRALCKPSLGKAVAHLSTQLCKGVLLGRFPRGPPWKTRVPGRQGRPAHSHRLHLLC